VTPPEDDAAAPGAGEEVKGNGEDKRAPEATGAAAEVAEEKGLALAPEPPPTAEQIEALRKEVAELRDQLLRRRADFENFKKRVERDRQAAALDAEAALLRELVPTLDNLERALQSAEEGSALREGVELIQRGLLALLQSRGVSALDPRGERFDPELHQALTSEAVPGVAEGTVVEVFRKGYRFKDRLLRPALVKVATGEGDRETDRETDSEAVH
jgi:molecular chaperone GrpE